MGQSYPGPDSQSSGHLQSRWSGCDNVSHSSCHVPALQAGSTRPLIGGKSPPARGHPASPAPYVFLLPARTPGWNKYTVANPSTLQLIEKEPNTQVLSAIHPGTEIWVKY